MIREAVTRGPGRGTRRRPGRADGRDRPGQPGRRQIDGLRWVALGLAVWVVWQVLWT